VGVSWRGSSRSLRAGAPEPQWRREFLLIGGVLRQAQHERRESGLGKHLDSRVDMIQTIVPYTKAALEGAK